VLVGHAGDVIGNRWYIVGGGNNTSGCTDMVALDLTPLATSDQTDDPLTWSTVSQAESRSAIVSEGLTVEAVPYARCLLSFGGYNGKYQSALQVFRPGNTIPLFLAQQHMFFMASMLLLTYQRHAAPDTGINAASHVDCSFMLHQKHHGVGSPALFCLDNKPVSAVLCRGNTSSESITPGAA